jgi:ribonuclease J
MGVDDQYYELKRDQAITPKSISYKTIFPGELEYSDVDEGDKPCIEDPKCGFKFTYEYNPKHRTYDTSSSGFVKGIEYKLIPVDHSIPGACSILLTLPDKKWILYTGDLRFHGSKSTTIEDYASAIGDQLDVLIVEGTRIDSTVTLREVEVQKKITTDIKDVEGLALISFGWKDLSRFDVVYEAAKANGRTLVISPNLAYLLYEMFYNFPEKYQAPTSLPSLKVYVKREDSLLYSKADYDKWKMGYLDFHGRNKAKADQNLVRVAEALSCGGEKCSATSPQTTEKTPKEITNTWELATHHLEHGVRAYKIREKPKDYVLMFTAMDVNELFDLIPTDPDYPKAHFISATTEPFSDEMEIDETRFMNWLDKFGVTYESEKDEKSHKYFARRHVSGHASQPELIELITTLNPKMIIPIHTEKPQLFQSLLPGFNVKIPEYGKQIAI